MSTIPSSAGDYNDYGSDPEEGNEEDAKMDGDGEAIEVGSVLKCDLCDRASGVQALAFFATVRFCKSRVLSRKPYWQPTDRQ